MKAAAFSLVVLTLNVAGPRRVHQGWPTRREAIVSRLQAAGADADAFQEVWRSEDLDALAAASGHAHRALDAELGVAVTSRLPIVSTASRALGGGYGVLRARLRAGSDGVDAYSARLEPGTGPAAARRLGQLFRLAEFVREQSAGRPFVLLGDLAEPADEREAGLLLDLLEARDLCVSHGDEVCGRTSGDRRVDYALIPYAPRAPRENARAAFTEILPEDDEDAPSDLRFGLRARLDASWLKLRPAGEPPGRDEALAAIADALEAARDDALRREADAGWIPFLGTLRAAAAADDAAGLAAVREEVRSALIRATRRRS